MTMAGAVGYSPLPSSVDENPDSSPRSRQKSRWFRWFYWLSTASSMLGMLVFGYYLGSLKHICVSSYPVTGYNLLGNPTHKHTLTSRTEPAGSLRYYMHFNGTFLQRPSRNSDASWDSLFPEKLGFVQHPILAPNVAGIAVFHELHCLNILRSAFWASVDGKLEEMGTESMEANHRTSHHHIRHCFEYLRQSLICLADPNMEEMNYTTRGVSGWQSERICRDFNGLKSWADEWGISREEALHDWDLQTGQGQGQAVADQRV